MKLGLSNNQLKILAMIAMTMDHLGIVFFPEVEWLRLVGRLAFPIFAYMIAEGCYHTKNMWRYLGSMALLAFVCQVVYFFAMDSLYMCIIVTFSLSIGLIGLLQFAQANKSFFTQLLFVAGVATVYYICHMLPKQVGHGFRIDYDFIGVMIPVALYAAKDRAGKLAVLILGLTCMAMTLGSVQWWALLSVPLLLLYNGRRGKWRMKWFFYIFYPAHLAIIQGVAYILAE